MEWAGDLFCVEQAGRRSKCRARVEGESSGKVKDPDHEEARAHKRMSHRPWSPQSPEFRSARLIREGGSFEDVFEDGQRNNSRSSFRTVTNA